MERLLSDLATEGQVFASTQRQALNALVLLYRHVLYRVLESTNSPVMARDIQQWQSPLDR